MQVQKEQIADSLKKLQQEICDKLEREDGKGKFSTDSWERPGGGGGVSKAIAGGAAIEKGGVNFSEVYGKIPPQLQEKFNVEKGNFYATGVSIVLHPWNPFVPTIHMNVRYFEMDNGINWFGGGIDLTPSYINQNEVKSFHKELKEICDRFTPKAYSEYKAWADDYFFIPHRQETRGVGGIFFDYLKADNETDKQSIFRFVLDLGELFAPLYCKMLASGKNRGYSDSQRDWQLIRRGRYVEFNLVYDRGTRFGLETSGRIESILMSMPAEARWYYDHQPQPNSPEQESLNYFKKGIDWI